MNRKIFVTGIVIFTMVVSALPVMASNATDVSNANEITMADEDISSILSVIGDSLSDISNEDLQLDDIVRTAVDIEEQNIFDEEDVIVNVIDIDNDGYWGYELSFEISNNKEINLDISLNDFSVNGFMIEPFFYETVNSGETLTAVCEIDDIDLEQCGIEIPAEIEFTINLTDADNWFGYNTTSEIIRIETSAFDENFEQEVDDDGNIVYDDNDVLIVSKNIEEGWFGPQCVFYIENNGEEDLTIQARDVYLNGEEAFSPTFSIDVAAGKKAITTMSMDSEHADIEVSDISSIKCIFIAFNEHTWEDIFETDVINIEF